METNFNFKSQICTTKEQSQKLLALGLKPETADCKHTRCWSPENGIEYDVPAWSLDRLMELVPHKHGEYCDYANNYMYYYNIPLDVVEQFVGETKYEYLIDCIEWLIEEGYFNKDYLEE